MQFFRFSCFWSLLLIIWITSQSLASTGRLISTPHVLLLDATLGILHYNCMPSSTLTLYSSVFWNSPNHSRDKTCYSLCHTQITVFLTRCLHFLSYGLFVHIFGFYISSDSGIHVANMCECSVGLFQYSTLLYKDILILYSQFC